jgi:hypothetical protein
MMRLTCKRCHADGKIDSTPGCEGCAMRLSTYKYRQTEDYRLVRRLSLRKNIPPDVLKTIKQVIQSRKQLIRKNSPEDHQKIEAQTIWLREIEKTHLYRRVPKNHVS